MNDSRVFVQLTSCVKTAVESGTLLIKVANLHFFISNDLVILA